MGYTTVTRAARRSRAQFIASLTAALAVVLTTFASSAASAAPNEFSDVPTNHKFRTEITWLADQQITTGYANGTFKPRDSVSREAFAAFLYRLAGKPKVSLPSTSPFKDVSTSSQFYREIVWLEQQNITGGWADGTFRPKNKISREAIAAFLYRFEGRPSFSAPAKSPFRDMTPSSKFYKEVTWLARTGITTGYADGTFKPKANVSREAVAAFLHRGNTIARADGLHEVGRQIPAGIYTATPARSSSGSFCMWERRTRGGISSAFIIAEGHMESGRVVVEIKPTDMFFYTYGCSGWTPLRKVSPNATSVSDGTHAVGYHMREGTYRAPGGQGCYAAKLRDFTGTREATMSEYQGKPADVRLTAGQGLWSKNCGTWKRVGN